MNHYLLDTHILLWWLIDDPKLDQRARDLIANPATRVLVSVVSIWEIVIKKSLGKLTCPDNLKELLQENDFTTLPLVADHVLQVPELPAIHADPFDRLLIAQSIVEDMPLITRDRIIPLYELKCL